MRTTTLIVSVALTAAAGGSAAYLLGPARVAALAPAPNPEQKAVLATFAKSLERDIPLARTRAQGRAMTPTQVAALEEGFDAVAREKGDSRVLERYRPSTVTGKRLARLAMSVRLAKQLPPGEQNQLLTAYLDDFIKNRDETLREGRSALASLSGPDFALERMGVLAVIGDLPDSSSDLKDLALKELTSEAPPARPSIAEAGTDPALRAQAMSWGPAQVQPLYAFTVYLNAVGNDPDQALGGAVEAIASQSDPGIRRGLAQAYLAAFPDHKPQLYRQLSQSQVQLPDITPGQMGPGRVSIPPQVVASVPPSGQ